MSHTIEEIKLKAIPILKEAGVTRSSLFGSIVRGEEREDSDIDFLIELPENKSLFDFIDLKLHLQDELGREVDLIEYDVIKPGIKDIILQEQIRIL